MISAANFLGGCALFTDEMSIGRHRDMRILMTQEMGDFGHWLAVGEQHTCKRMPESMRGKPFHLGLADRLIE